MARIVTRATFGWDVAHGAVTRRPPGCLDTVVPRTGDHTYAARVWDLSIVFKEHFLSRAVPNPNVAIRSTWRLSMQHACTSAEGPRTTSGAVQSNRTNGASATPLGPVWVSHATQRPSTCRLSMQHACTSAEGPRTTSGAAQSNRTNGASATPLGPVWVYARYPTTKYMSSVDAAYVYECGGPTRDERRRAINLINLIKLFRHTRQVLRRLQAMAHRIAAQRRASRRRVVAVAAAAAAVVAGLGWGWGCGGWERRPKAAAATAQQQQQQPQPQRRWRGDGVAPRVRSRPTALKPRATLGQG
jgi:hypothetical protein